jgi:uncharacterized protein YpmS
MMFEKLKSKNKWKTLFWSLAIINIIVILGSLFLLSLSPSHTRAPSGFNTDGDGAEFTVSSTKQNLTQLANRYLQDLPKNKTLTYSISLEDDVQLRGSITAFEKRIPLTATFEPIVQENGDLILQLQSITLGRLYVPNRAVLQYVKDHYHMPNWVAVNPNKESIYLAVTEMKTKSEFRVKVERFDLKQDDLVFKITVPNKTFGF